jgi:putative oxidoreductase
MHIIDRVVSYVKPAIRILEYVSPVIDLGIRLWVANVFWKSGLTKIQTFDSTIMLFQYEYQVPLISPVVAAYLGTFTELFFPILLVLGLGGRFAAAVLFVFNFFAVISYPGLNPVGVEQHQIWGLMLLVTLLHGPGKISIDHFLRRKWMAAI